MRVVPVDIDSAIYRLCLCNEMKIAEELMMYRSSAGDRKGWDGWVRGRYPRDVVDTIWPPQKEQS